MASLNDNLDYIKIQILEELEATGMIDINHWLRSYPDHKPELRDFALWAERSNDEPDIDIAPGQRWTDHDQVATRVLRSWSQILEVLKNCPTHKYLEEKQYEDRT